jgi:hypothetical protein
MKSLLSENILIDDERDILTAYGNSMTGELLRALSAETPDDLWFRIVKTTDGVCRLEVSVLERPRTAANAH